MGEFGAVLALRADFSLIETTVVRCEFVMLFFLLGVEKELSEFDVV